MRAEKVMLCIIIPTLNEERNLALCLSSLQSNCGNQYEVIIVDGGSKDQTVGIAEKYCAKIIIEPACPEFKSRNMGAEKAKGDILLFTCADVIFPKDLLSAVHEKFAEDNRLIALSGPGIPFDAPAIGRIEYEFYNLFRYILAKLPQKLKRFSASTNFLAMKKSVFKEIGGFQLNDVNADGIMGKKLAEIGKIQFSMGMRVYISARRMRNMGFINFNKHYLYVLENFFPELSGTAFLKSLKQKSGRVHKKMHKRN
jgi:glycosyltransferase involved in cell wall biosynthesis